jgi:hypothetical protein
MTRPFDFSRVRNIADAPNPRPVRDPLDPSATPRQLGFIRAIAREYGIAEGDLQARCERRYGRRVEDLSRRDASSFIERLQSRRNLR